LGPPEQLPPENRDRIKSPKHCVLKERRMMHNVQKCEHYIKSTFFYFVSIESNVKGPEAF
jgi:hypothetical protein